MKRRTKKPKRDPIGYDHRLAFNYAAKVMNPLIERRARNGKPNYNRRGERIRFEVVLETEDGAKARAVFSCTKGFEVFMNPLLSPDHTVAALSKRHACSRLKAYRSSLLLSQELAESPLSFRSFNLLLAALSYDIAANL